MSLIKKLTINVGGNLPTVKLNIHVLTPTTILPVVAHTVSQETANVIEINAVTDIVHRIISVERIVVAGVVEKALE